MESSISISRQANAIADTANLQLKIFSAPIQTSVYHCVDKRCLFAYDGTLSCGEKPEVTQNSLRVVVCTRECTYVRVKIILILLITIRKDEWKRLRKKVT